MTAHSCPKSRSLLRAASEPAHSWLLNRSAAPHSNACQTRFRGILQGVPHKRVGGFMNVLARSVGNAFRNKVRSGAVVVILAVAIGLALSMLVANQAVAGKIAELKSSVGNALTINPAGARGFQGGGEPL